MYHKESKNMEYKRSMNEKVKMHAKEMNMEKKSVEKKSNGKVELDGEKAIRRVMQKPGDMECGQGGKMGPYRR